jgi:hypothetical protein
MTKILLFILFSFSTNALVDYTEKGFRPESNGPKPVRSKRKPAPKQKSIRTISGPSSSPSFGVMDFALQYATQDVELDNKTGKTNRINFEGHIETGYNIFIDFSFWQAASNTQILSQKSSYQNGNPEFKLGVNWLEFGGQEEAATIDLYIGSTFAQKNSAFASSRNDRIVGLTTAKRFYDFALGLGYELRLTSTPDDKEEKEIGNIKVLSASIGWMVSSDIRFLVEANNYRVDSSDALERESRLERKLSFSTVAPKVLLNISPLVLLEMGGTFRTRRLKDSDLTKSKLWHYEGSYGNNVFAGLRINI